MNQQCLRKLFSNFVARNKNKCIGQQRWQQFIKQFPIQNWQLQRFVAICGLTTFFFAICIATSFRSVPFRLVRTKGQRANERFALYLPYICSPFAHTHTHTPTPNICILSLCRKYICSAVDRWANKENFISFYLEKKNKKEKRNQLFLMRYNTISDICNVSATFLCFTIITHSLLLLHFVCGWSVADLWLERVCMRFVFYSLWVILLDVGVDQINK